jgi:hypothetical protein
MSTVPVLKIVSVDGKFQIQDEKGGVYGTHDTKAQAEAILQDWVRYYADCQDVDEEEEG